MDPYANQPYNQQYPSATDLPAGNLEGQPGYHNQAPYFPPPPAQQQYNPNNFSYNPQQQPVQQQSFGHGGPGYEPQGYNPANQGYIPPTERRADENVSREVPLDATAAALPSPSSSNPHESRSFGMRSPHTSPFHDNPNGAMAAAAGLGAAAGAGAAVAGNGERQQTWSSRHVPQQEARDAEEGA